MQINHHDTDVIEVGANFLLLCQVLYSINILSHYSTTEVLVSKQIYVLNWMDIGQINKDLPGIDLNKCLWGIAKKDTDYYFLARIKQHFLAINVNNNTLTIVESSENPSYNTFYEAIALYIMSFLDYEEVNVKLFN